MKHFLPVTALTHNKPVDTDVDSKSCAVQ